MREIEITAKWNSGERYVTWPHSTRSGWSSNATCP